MITHKKMSLRNLKVLKDPFIKPLLDRREEIKPTINKLEAEYEAIGKILIENHNLKNILKQKEMEEK